MLSRTAFILVIFVLCTLSLSANAMHVVLDPGHGGRDTGATQGRLTESAITLSIANLVARELKNNSQFTVSLTRTDDSYISLEKRAAIANTKGDLFLSIHANSSTDTRVNGKEIYFQNQLPADEEALFLSSRENQFSATERFVPRAVSLALVNKKNINSDVRAIVEDLERNHRLKLSGLFAEKIFYKWQGQAVQKSNAIRQAPFFVVSNIDKPAVLVEIGYLTNPKEAKQLTNHEYQVKIANGIYKAIVSFKESLDKPTNKSLN